MIYVFILFKSIVSLIVSFPVKRETFVTDSLLYCFVIKLLLHLVFRVVFFFTVFLGGFDFEVVSF